jgi:hypothetical protein
MLCSTSICPGIKVRDGYIEHLLGIEGHLLLDPVRLQVLHPELLPPDPNIEASKQPFQAKM